MREADRAPPPVRLMVAARGRFLERPRRGPATRRRSVIPRMSSRFGAATIGKAHLEAWLSCVLHRSGTSTTTGALAAAGDSRPRRGACGDRRLPQRFAGIAFVLDGEPGIGGRRRCGWQRSSGRARAGGRSSERGQAEVEATFAFASLRDLLGDLPSQAWQRLPEVQRHALAVALAEDEAGSSTVEAGVLGVAVLGVLGTLAAERPLLLASTTCSGWTRRAARSSSTRSVAWPETRPSAGRVSRQGRETIAIRTSASAGSASREATRARAAERGRRPTDVAAASRAQALRRRAARPVRGGGGNPFFALELGQLGDRGERVRGGMRLPRSLQERRRMRGYAACRHQRVTRLLCVAALADPP